MPSAIDPQRRLLLATGLALALPGARASSRAMEIGVMPYLPTATLIAGHQPLRDHLATALGRPANLSTAPDFPTFHRRTLAGEYDLAVTGPPLAWHAHRLNKMTWIAVSDRKLRILLLVPTDSPVRGVADLRGGTVATIAAMTITAQTAAEILRDHGLEPGGSVHLRHERNPANAIQATLLGEASAAAFPDVSLPGLPEDMRARLRVIHESVELPSIAFVARRADALPPPEAVQRALLGFARDTAAGARFLQQFNHGGLSPPDLRALRILDRYLPELNRQMAEG